MKTVRASEIGTYFYCQRAYWYQLQGIPSENQRELVSGMELHSRHGREIATSSCLKMLAYISLLSGLVFLIIYGIQEIF